jgi:outer membrane lipoprotein-sorting protein
MEERMSKEHRKYPFDLCDFIFRRLRLRGSTHVDSRSRKRQEKSWISFATIILVSAFAIADPNPLNSKSSIDDVLDALQARGKNLTSFTAAVTSTDTDANGAETTRTGKLAYQVKPGGGARVHLVFDQKQFDQNPPLKEKKEYLLDNGWITDRDYPPARPNETRRQLAKPGDKIDLFRLGKGMCPLPIGQDKDDVHQEFDIVLVAPAADDPSDTIHLTLKPKPKTEFARKFAAIDVWVDMKLDMPVRVITTQARTLNPQQWDLRDMKVNPAIPDGDFQLPPWDAKWLSHDEPLAQ